MQFYSFWDYDETMEEDRDLCGEDYRTLLSFCFLHASWCSLLFEDRFRYIPPLRTNLTKDEETLLIHLREKTRKNEFGETWFFPCVCPMEAFLAKHCYSVFDWNTSHQNPVNLAFYREDGSILFASNAHIGVCYLCLQENEAGSFLQKQGWNKEIEPYYDSLEALLARPG